MDQQPLTKCDACLMKIDEDNFFECAKCQSCFHHSCLGPVRADKQVCPICVIAARTPIRHESKSTDTPNAPRVSHVTGRSKQRQLVSRSLEPSPPECTETGTLAREIRLFRDEMVEIKRQIHELSQKVTKYQDKLEELVGNIASHELRLTQLERRDNQVLELQSKVQELELEVQSRDQASLRNELEISGLTEHTGENLYHTVLLTARKIGVELEDRDIDWITRAGPKHAKIIESAKQTEVDSKTPSDRVRPVVVRFVRLTKRNQFLAATKPRRQTLTTAEIEVAGPTRQLFFNERLSHRQRQLFRETKQRTREYGFKFCWTKNGHIYARQREGRQSIHIQSRLDFDKLFGNSPASTNNTGKQDN